ncbi:hypothetical protein F4823DRAFT_596116 [Ustulina deusta]|nr:hypothetical protein F4823DRAFT_596116 [Ustulina deusta]
MTTNTTTFETCDGCHRSLRLGMFCDVRTGEMSKVCRCCKYQAALAENPRPRSPISSWWRSAVRTYFKE